MDDSNKNRTQQTKQLGIEEKKFVSSTNKACRPRYGNIIQQKTLGPLEVPVATVESQKAIPGNNISAGRYSNAGLAEDIGEKASRRRRYSGAARRKFKKAKEAAAASAVTAAAASTTVAGTDEPPGTWSSLCKNQNGKRWHTPFECSEGFEKRQRVFQEIPHNAYREVEKPRPAGEPENGSYAATANVLYKLAIVHSGRVADITKEQSALIQVGLMEIVDEIPVGDFTPRFQGIYLHRGALKVLCADQQTSVWLRDQVKNLRTWEGARLEVIEVEALLKYVLKLAIVHSGLVADITKEQSALIQEGLMEIVDEIPVGDFVPRFQRTYLYRGALRVVCADQQTSAWLRDQVENLRTWEGARLEVIEVDALPKYVRVLVSLPGISIDTATVLRRLEKQNPGLTTAGWITYRRRQEASGKGMRLVLGVEPRAIPVLRAQGMRPYFGMGRASFRLLDAYPGKVQEEQTNTEEGAAQHDLGHAFSPEA